MNNTDPIIPFAFGDQLFRVIDHEGAPWFAGPDACAALELENVTRALEGLDEDEKFTLTNPQGNPRAGIPHQLTIISESGLYRLIFKSRKPAAKALQRFVFHEVLPTIRRTGSYQAPAAPPRDLPPHAIQTLDMLDELLGRGMAPKEAARLLLKMELPAPAILPGLPASHPRAPEIDDILSRFQPGHFYSIDDVVAGLPKKHWLAKGTMPSIRSRVGKMLARAIGLGRIRRDPESTRHVRYGLPEVAEFPRQAEP